MSQLQQLKTNILESQWLKYFGYGVMSACALFLLMYVIILPGDTFLDSDKNRSVVDFIRLKKDDSLNERERRIPKKPPPPTKPPPPKLETPDNAPPPTPQLDIDIPDIDMPLDLQGANIRGGLANAGDGGLIPLVRIAPRYPTTALRAGKTGYVRVQLQVDENGNVTSAKVVDSKPPRIFDAAAIQAILKWKFKPRVEGGVPIPQAGITTIEFNI